MINVYHKEIKLKMIKIFKIQNEILVKLLYSKNY